MSKVLIFAGTTEGRQLSEWLCEKGCAHDLCVATEYGEQVLNEDPLAKVHTGRMDEGQIASFIEQEKVQVVVDATHPYAKEATENIRQAAEEKNVVYLRLDRNKTEEESEAAAAEKYYFPDTALCIEALAKAQGNILLTTGSKELPEYCANEEVRERIYARVLPGSESIAICEKSGIPGKRIIAMQGPFSLEMNLAIIRDHDIKIMVTKQTGKSGGFAEKEAAAAKAGIPLYVIGVPENSAGMSAAEVRRTLYGYLDDHKRKISLIGCGMGHPENLTVEAFQAMQGADLVFGAKRILEDCKITAESYPYYFAKDIIPVLKEKPGDAAILFSGDSGFYSGATKMTTALKEAVANGELTGEIKVYPGISSVSNLAALFGISWEDATLFSVHGRGTVESWRGRLLHTIRTSKKTFLLVSGVDDLKTIGAMLSEEGMEEVRILAGYQMSYPEQELLDLAPADCGTLEKDGLYALFILNPRTEVAAITHGLPDSSFIRAKVPMTKEEVRTSSISKLHLTGDAVVYDVGSGTGSIAVEIARISPDIRVYAIERKEDALDLIRQNTEAFGLTNVMIVPAYAPEGLEDLPAPTHVFIGGSGGNLKEILSAIFAKNPKASIVANAVSHETFEEFLQIEKDFDVADFDIVQMAVTRTRKVGNYHMLQAENPVWICSFKGNGA